MKSALSLILIASLMDPAIPVTAHAQTEPPVSFDIRGVASDATTGPLARAITREAVRLAADPVPSDIAAVQEGDTLPESDWSRVPKLAAGTEVIVTVKGSQPATRYVVQADESELTVKVARLGQVVEHIVRSEIIEIRVFRTIPPYGLLWGILFGISGLPAGAYIGQAVAPSSGDTRGDEGDRGKFGGAMLGAFVGVIAGAALGYLVGSIFEGVASIHNTRVIFSHDWGEEAQ